MNVPPDRLGVPFDEFVAALDEAVRRCRDQKHDRYHASVLATLAWVAGITDQDPLTRQQQPAEPAAMVEAQMQAAEVVYGWPEALPGVHREWAVGVLATVAWTRGVQARPPLRQPGGTRPGGATRPAGGVEPFVEPTTAVQGL